MKPLSHKILSLNPSVTVSLDNRAKSMLEEGIDVINLTSGEPKEPCPPEAAERAIEAIEKGYSKYNSAAGLLELRQAICEKLKKENGALYRPEDITVSSGAKHAFFNALNTIINPGDEVLIFSPYWVTYPELVKLFGGVPVIVPTEAESNFKPEAKILEKYLSPRSKALILNSPNNPSGAIIDAEELEKIAELTIAQDLYCISDEIYERLIYGEKPNVSPSSLSREMYQRCILVNGVSKCFAMTGWRIGYSAAPTPIASRINAFQGQSSHHPSLPAQYGALGAFTSGGGYIRQLVNSLKERRDFVQGKLNDIPRMKFILPEGAFYFLLDVKPWLNNQEKNRNTEEMCLRLLEKQKLALVPGSAFGLEGWLRLSFTSKLSELKQGLERLKKGLSEIN